MFKIFKKQKKDKQFDSFDKPRFDEKIQSEQLIYSRPSDDFYNDLLELLIPSFFNESNPIHKKFDEEFRSNISELSILFNDILESGLQTDTIDKFYLRIEHLAKKEREVPFITSQTLLYWYHFIQNIKIEVSSRIGDNAINKCDILSDKIKQLFEDFRKKNSHKK